MKKTLLPLNIKLYDLKPEQIKAIGEVSVLDIMDGPGGNFHEQGLFSTAIFGRTGDPERSKRFGYIDLKLPILHPVVYKIVTKLKGLYGEILSGTGYAVWNPATKDFEKSDELNGKTGYQFFMQHWEELEPPKTGSFQRDLNIELINKYRKGATIDKLLVMPAGLRDVEIGADGRVSSDEINELYQNVLMMSRNIPSRKLQPDEWMVYDRTRYALTIRVRALFEHIENLLSGKNGLIQSRWASRRVFNGTRNVISSQDTSPADLNQPNRPKFNDSVIGLYQAARACLPHVIYSLRNSVVGQIFDTSSNTVELVHPKTYKRVWVDVSNEDMDRWGTEEGLDQVINELSVIEKRHRPVMINDHYLALVYVDDQDNFKILRCISEVPPEFDTKWVRPITYVELIYLANLYQWHKNRAFVTRYPVENSFSSYPSKVYVKTTIVGELRYELDDEWQRKGDEFVALEYPKLLPDQLPQYHDSLSVSPSRLKKLGGD